MNMQRVFFLGVALATLVLAGCTRLKHAVPQAPIGGADRALTCPEEGGVLGLRLESSRYFTNYDSVGKATVRPGDVSRALMDTGCFSAVRMRQTVAMKGHHIDYHLTTREASCNMLFFPLYFLSVQLIPLPCYTHYDARLEYYFNGEKRHAKRWSEKSEQLFGLIGGLYPIWNTRQEYSREQGDRLADVFVASTLEEGAAQ